MFGDRAMSTGSSPMEATENGNAFNHALRGRSASDSLKVAYGGRSLFLAPELTMCNCSQLAGGIEEALVVLPSPMFPGPFHQPP